MPPSPLTFLCSICLDSVTNPVATQCGHVFCWECLHQWLSAQSSALSSRTGEQVSRLDMWMCGDCPACKRPVSVGTLVPLYATNGGESKGRRRRTAQGASYARLREVHLKQHPNPEEKSSRYNMATIARGFDMAMPAWDKLLSYLFPPTTTPDEQNVFLSKLLLCLGSVVVVCLLLC